MNKYATKYLLDSEDILDHAGQLKYLGCWPLFSDLLVMSDRRILFIHPTLTGCSFEDALWMYVKNIQLQDHIFSSTLTCTMLDGHKMTMPGLRKNDALRLYKIGQRMEEKMLEYRRRLELDKNRAGAANIVLNNQDTTTALPTAPLTQYDTTSPVNTL